MLIFKKLEEVVMEEQDREAINRITRELEKRIERLEEKVAILEGKR